MKAMILAAGLGTRMRPLTLKTPKPLLKVGGKPLIEWHIERLVDLGITQLVINHAWLGEQIESYLGSGERFGAHIEYSAESEPLETGGGIFRALSKLITHEEDTFLVINADVFCDVSWEDLLSQPLKETDVGRLLMVPNPSWHPSGDFLLNKASGYLSLNQGEPMTFSGISLLRGRLFAGCRDESFALAPLLRKAIVAHQLQGVAHQGVWSDVGTPERLAEVDRLLHEGGKHEC